jgi:hypothetical protein
LPTFGVGTSLRTITLNGGRVSVTTRSLTSWPLLVTATPCSIANAPKSVEPLMRILATWMPVP